MLQVEDVKIVLNQPLQGSFFSGSEVSGTLFVQADSPKSCTFIKVKLHGHAHVLLWEKYTSNVELVNSEVTVWTREEALNGMLQRGQYSFPFQFTLPEQVPSSFQSNEGFIEYSVEGWIFPRGAGVPLVTKVHVPVTETVTVNPPQLQTPVIRQVQQQIRHWYSLHSSGNVVLTVEAPRTSYCAGEQIPLTVKVQNDTHCLVRLKAVLLRTTTYSAQGVNFQTTYKIMKLHRRDTVSTITWRPMSMETHQSEHVTSTSANIIRVKHCVQVTAKVVMPLSVDKLVKIEIPLTIGNVINEVMDHPPPPSPAQLPTQEYVYALTRISAHSLPPSKAPPTATPPTYDMAVGKTTTAICQGISPLSEPPSTPTKWTSLSPPPYEVALSMRSLKAEDEI